MHAERKNEARWCNHCCCVKAISITYSDCMFVTLVIQQEMRLRHVVICGLPCPAKFFYFISYTARFPGKKSY